MFVCLSVCAYACVPAQSGEILKTVKEHTKQINDIQSSVDLTMIITASKDCSAKARELLHPLHTQWHHNH